MPLNKYSKYPGCIGVWLLFSSCFLQPAQKGPQAATTAGYEWVQQWPDLPAGIQWGNPTGMGLDTGQHIVVFHRAGRTWPLTGAMPTTRIPENTIAVMNKNDGQMVSSWGRHLFVIPHGLKVDNQQNIWVTDVGLHQVFKFSYDGRLLLQLGEAGVAGRDRTHFNKPTDVAVASDGSFYVSDGYGNSRVIKFSATGGYLFEWGTKGRRAGAFRIPHGLALDNKGQVYVADRENKRVQVFDAGGNYLRQFTGASWGAVCAVAWHHNKLYVVDDRRFLKVKHRGSDMMVIDSTGTVIARVGRSGGYAGPACWYHCMAVDGNEDIYVGDILGNKVQKFRKAGRK